MDDRPDAMIEAASARRDAVLRAYRAILGREPTADEMRDGTNAAGAAAALLDSPEYRARFRDASSSGANAEMAITLWPAERRDYDLQIVILSGEEWPKCRRTIEAIVPSLTDRICLTVLCGEPGPEPFPYAQPGRVELVVVPGLSVFQLRARLPALLKETMWVAMLEDHTEPLPGWLDGVRAVLPTLDDKTLTISGSVVNQNSTDAWSWANFLFNFAWHWHPAASETLPGTVATTLFRRDLVGLRPFEVFRSEPALLGRKGPVSNVFTINHIQHTNWWTATIHVFDNGRVAGGGIRRNTESPRREAWNMVRYVTGPRIGEIAAVLEAHPRYAELPSGTIPRIRWISLCHSVGVLFGVVVGGGGAHKRLE
jgi:hypothetical protein